MFCPGCGNEISAGASFCRSCGRKAELSQAPAQLQQVNTPLLRPTTQLKATPVGAVVSVLLLAGSIWFFFGGGLERKAASDLSIVEQQVATDAVKQYEIARRSGTPMDACVHAGLVAAAYIQAKDEPNYQRWKAIEKSDCREAGVEQP